MKENKLGLLTAFGKSLMWLWPFISEVFFEGKQFKQIVKENKLVFVLLALLFVSMFFTYSSMNAVHRMITRDSGQVAIAAGPPNKNKEQKKQTPVNSEQEDQQYVKDQLEQIFGK